MKISAALHLCLSWLSFGGEERKGSSASTESTARKQASPRRESDSPWPEIASNTTGVSHVDSSLARGERKPSPGSFSPSKTRPQRPPATPTFIRRVDRGFTRVWCSCSRGDGEERLASQEKRRTPKGAPRPFRERHRTVFSQPPGVSRPSLAARLSAPMFRAR